MTKKWKRLCKSFSILRYNARCIWGKIIHAKTWTFWIFICLVFYFAKIDVLCNSSIIFIVTNEMTQKKRSGMGIWMPMILVVCWTKTRIDYHIHTDRIVIYSVSLTFCFVSFFLLHSTGLFIQALSTICHVSYDQYHLYIRHTTAHMWCLYCVQILIKER